MFAFVDETALEFHTHYYIVSAVKEKTLRSHLRDVVGSGSSTARGNAIYSLSEMTLDNQPFAVEYLAYMCKEGKVYLSELFPTDWLQLAKQADAVVKASIKEKRKQKGTVLQVIESAVLENWETISDGYRVNPDGEILTSNTLVPFVVKLTKAKGTLVREFALVSIIQTLLLKYDPSFEDILQTKLLEKILK